MEQDIEAIVGTFISLKYDEDTDDYTDGTAQRWQNMIDELVGLVTIQTAKARYRELVDLAAKKNSSHRVWCDYYEERYKFLKNVIATEDIKESK